MFESLKKTNLEIIKTLFFMCGLVRQLKSPMMVKLSSQGKIKLDGLYLTGGDYDTKIREAKVETSTIVKLPPLGISFVEYDKSATTIPLYNSKFFFD